MKHKHAELIKAWADGAKIQLWWADGWVDSENPNWGGEIYRIKPEPKPEPVRTSMRLNLQLLIERDGPIARVVGAEVVK